MKSKGTAPNLVPFCASLIREMLLAALQSDPAVKSNFRALPLGDQERIRAEVNKQASKLGKDLLDYLRAAGIDPLSTRLEVLRPVVQDFLNRKHLQAVRDASST